MTVSDLIKELRTLPQDVPVVINYKELTIVDLCDSHYILDENSKDGYSIEQAVVLE